MKAFDIIPQNKMFDRVEINTEKTKAVLFGIARQSGSDSNPLVDGTPERTEIDISSVVDFIAEIKSQIFERSGQEVLKLKPIN